MAVDLIVGKPRAPEAIAASERNKLRQGADAEYRANEAATGLSEQMVRADVGDADFHQGRRAVRSYMAGLSADERAAVVNDLKLDGSGLLTPEQLHELGRRAIGGIPTRREDIDAELAKIRKRMLEDSRGYYADDVAQMRYRALLQASGDRTAPQANPDQEVVVRGAPREIVGTGWFPGRPRGLQGNHPEKGSNDEEGAR